MGKGVLALPAGTNVLRLLPPLVIEKAEVDVVADKIEEALSEKVNE
jgi:acetylornithine/LysW-gamma-L-lysine aminotransferase